MPSFNQKMKQEVPIIGAEEPEEMQLYTIPYHMLSPEMKIEYANNIKRLKDELYDIPLKIVELGSGLIGKSFESLVHEEKTISLIKKLWFYYCLLEDKIAMFYEYKFESDKPSLIVNVEYNSWPQFRKRPVTLFEPDPRYPELRKISRNTMSSNIPPKGFDNVVPGRSWMDYDVQNWIITSFVNTDYSTFYQSTSQNRE